MKKLITILFLFQIILTNAQEIAVNYIIPKVNSVKGLYPSEVKEINEDFTSIDVNVFKGHEIKYEPIIETDGSITYKLIYYKSGLLYPIEDYAYFINFTGNKAVLKGYSKYNIKTDFLFDAVEGETFTALSTPTTYYQVPSESYQTTEWTYSDPISGKTIKAKGYYKTMAFHDNNERIFVVEHVESGTFSNKIKKEYFLKNFGLIATQYKQDEIVYITDLVPFKLYSNTYMESLTEEKARTLGWDMIRKIRSDMDFSERFEEDELLSPLTMDSLVGLYEHMMIKYPVKENLHRYILSLIYTDWAEYYYYKAKKEDFKLSSTHRNIMENLNHFYLMRLTPDYIPTSDLRGYVTGIDDGYYYDYWHNMFLKFSTVFKNGITPEYYVYLLKNDVSSIEKNESTIKGSNLFLLHSYMATYYVDAKDNKNAYYNYVLTLENYKSLNDKDKDVNIEYMKVLMSEMIQRKPSNEVDLIRGINAALSLNDNLNALKIAENGYSNGVGISLDFSMLFAKIAYNNDVDKPYLRKAMQLMQDKLSLMTSEQIKNYLIYCKAMSPEFDCAKAEVEVKKIEKREAEEREKKLKEDKKKARKNSYSSGERKANLALAFNPFAGLNMKGKGSAFKFLPVSVELRTGIVVHEFRLNSFFGFDAKNRFVGGKIIENLPSYSAGWKNITGNDYSYGIYFMENKFTSYDKKCQSQGGGFQFLYGNFNTDPELTNVRVNSFLKTVTLRPEITRMELLVNWKGNIYNWKTHLFVTGFWGIGAGTRSIKYNCQDLSISEADLSNETISTFDDKRFVQANWKGYYFTMRMGLRFGLTLF